MLPSKTHRNESPQRELRYSPASHVTGLPPKRSTRAKVSAARLDTTTELLQRNIAWALQRTAQRERIWLEDDDVRALAAGLVHTVISLPYTRHRHRSADGDNPAPVLTQQQKRALIGVAHGLTNQEVGTRIGLSVDTVKSHLRRAYAELGARGAAHAVSIAICRGIITKEDLES